MNEDPKYNEGTLQVAPDNVAAIGSLGLEGKLVEIELPLVLSGNKLMQTGKSIIRVPRNMVKTSENPYALVQCDNVDESTRAISALVTAVQDLGLTLGGIGGVTNDKAEFALYRCVRGRNLSQEYTDSVSFMKYLEDKRPYLSMEIAGGFVGPFRRR